MPSPVDSPICERKVLPCRNKAEQHPRDLAEVTGARNVYRDGITTAGGQGTLIRVANIEKLYIVDRKVYNNRKRRRGDMQSHTSND